MYKAVGWLSHFDKLIVSTICFAQEYLIDLFLCTISIEMISCNFVLLSRGAVLVAKHTYVDVWIRVRPKALF